MLPGSAMAQPALTTVGQFSSPVYVTAPPGDYHRLFVVELAGRVRIVKDGVVLATPFLDISSQVGTTYPGGLLSIAFPPDYAKSGRFYAYYTNASLDIRVAEFQRSKKPDVAKAGFERTILTQPRTAGIVDHYGGQLQFGPDGRLYISIGDGGPAGDPNGHAQNLGLWWGKLLRIDPQRKSATLPYRVPSDNPFVGVAGARPEIWAYGLRNPWRFSFDRSTGDLTIGDVGQERVDEVDFGPNTNGGGRGANYGWNCLEGSLAYASCTASNPVAPVLEISHTSTDSCSYSISGGYVVRDAGLPTLSGRYVYGDYCHGEVRSAQLAVPTATGDASTGLSLSNYSLVSFGEDGCGRLHAVSLNGPVYRMQDGTASPCPPGP